MSADPRLQADAELLEALAQGSLPEGDPRLRQLLERRPQWRELLEHARAGTSWTAAASEADRRLVAECLAQARAPALPAAAEIEPRARPGLPRRTLLVALAATIVAAGALLLWWPRDRDRTSSPREMLDQSVDWFEEGQAAPDFGTFAWKFKSAPPHGQVCVLSIWASAADGTRGRRLFHEPVGRETKHFTPAETADWPERVIWQVELVDTSGGTIASPEWRAQRAPR
jgi:hypothetical protein